MPRGKPEGAHPRRTHGGLGAGSAHDQAMSSTTHRAADGRAGTKSHRAPPGKATNPQRIPPRPAPLQHDLWVTHPAGEPGSTPTGVPARVEPGDDDITARSRGRENEVAADLADRGYEIHQRPLADEVATARALTGDIGDPGRDPDYLIEGRVFDCYSPERETNVRGIWTTVEKKIKKLQTQRVVVDLQEWSGSLTAVRRQFADWPIANLREVKFILPDGTIEQFDPNP